jgi:hypothetical protein
MKYKRKTKDVFSIQGNYGCGWEEVTEEENYKDAIKQLKCYRENETNYPHRMRFKRVPINN